MAKKRRRRKGGMFSRPARRRMKANLDLRRLGRLRLWMQTSRRRAKKVTRRPRRRALFSR